MAQHRQPPTEAQLQAFGDRLTEFRESLTEEQRPLLDTMLAAALRPEGAAEAVQSYWVQYDGIRTSPNPGWYSGSGAAAWNNTSWGTAWLNY
jgi:hypothetical protein